MKRRSRRATGRFIVVEGLARASGTVDRAGTSNTDGQVSAGGALVSMAMGSNSYGLESGTSFATPLVTGDGAMGMPESVGRGTRGPR